VKRINKLHFENSRGGAVQCPRPKLDEGHFISASIDPRRQATEWVGPWRKSGRLFLIFFDESASFGDAFGPICVHSALQFLRDAAYSFLFAAMRS
jgi:hypothetical protein